LAYSIEKGVWRLLPNLRRLASICRKEVIARLILAPVPVDRG
jgi:hypothetical protein